MAKKNNFNFTNVIAAAGGGAVVNFGLDMLEDKVEIFEDKPILGPLLFEGLGTALTYFGGSDSPIGAAGYGMIGAATGEIVSLQKAKQGFSRVNVNKRRFLNENERETMRERFKRRKPMNGYDEDETNEDENDGM